MLDESHPRSLGANLPRPSPPVGIFTEGWSFVLTSRILPATFFSIAALSKGFGLITFLRTAEQSGQSLLNLAVILSIGARGSVALFFGLMVFLYVVRLRPIKKSQGFWPRALALVGTFMMSLVAVIPQREPSVVRLSVAGLLLVFGYGITISALSVLGRSFSIMPEARKLVSRGPYSHVRHPMYLGEMFVSAGMAFEVFSPFAAVLFVAFVWVQIQRAKYEEGVLAQVFPDYDAYKRKTARLIPKVY